MSTKVTVLLVGLALVLGFVVGNEHRKTTKRHVPTVTENVAGNSERVSMTVPPGTCLRSATLDVVNVEGDNDIQTVPPDCWVIGFSDSDRVTRRVILKPRPESFAAPSIP